MIYLAAPVLVAVFCVVNAHDNDLPDFIEPCDIDGLEACVKERMSEVLPRFAQGIPEYKVPSIDPAVLKDIVIDQNNLLVKLMGAEMHGLSNVTVTNLKINLINNASITLGFIGNLSLTANYTADGRILILPIKGNGEALIETKNVEVNITARLKNITDTEGHSHLKLLKPSYKYDLQSMSFDLKNLFNGNKNLAETTLKFINENWEQLMTDFAQPAIQQIVATIVKAINKFFLRVPIDKMFKGAENITIS